MACSQRVVAANIRWTQPDARLVCALLRSLVFLTALTGCGQVERSQTPAPSTADAPAVQVGEIIAARDAGDYARAKRLLALALLQNPADARTKTLNEEFSRQVQPELRLRYAKKQSGAQRQAETDELLELSAADEYYFLLNLPCECYVYLFFVDSTGHWTALMPNTSFVPIRNPLPRGEYRIPGATRGSLQPTPYPGAEKLYAIVTGWRHEAFEDLASRLARPQSPNAVTDLAVDLLKRLRYEQQFKNEIPGFAFGSLALHNGSSPKPEAVSR